MKLTPHEHKIHLHFKPGILTKNGFLGHDKRHIHDIVLHDQRTLKNIGVDAETIAEKLQEFIMIGELGMGGTIEHGDFEVQVFWHKGKMPCPFGEPGLHHKIVATVKNMKLNKKIHYSQLSIHLIKEHCFFGGTGSTYRLEPEDVVEVLGLQKKVTED